jgi:thiol:disulfide interchange protein
MTRLLSRLMGASFLMGALALPALAGPRCCAGKSIQWINGYEKGLAQAKSQHKIAVMDFVSDSCPWCGEMDQKTFASPSIVKLSKQFVMVRVDAMKERRQSVRHQVRGYPTILVLDAKGNEITRVVGYRDAPDLTGDLKEALTKAASARQTASR